MAVKRYIANKDNTITNAFAMDLTTRGTGSNMGSADILEVFSIFGQQQTTSSAATGSVELSRVLVEFPIDTISANRAASLIPASGSVNFYLRMSNARHSEQLAKDITVNVLAISQSWQEGTGLDMVSYKDTTRGGEGSNWINATGARAKATLIDAVDLSGIAQNDAFTLTVPKVAGGDGVAHQFVFDNGTDVESLSDANGFGINIAGAADDAAVAAVVIKAINGVADNPYQYGGAALGAGSTLAAGTLGITASAGSSATKVTLTMTSFGSAGNVENVLAANTGFENNLLLESRFVGGTGPWATIGGHYHSSSYTAGETMPNYTFTFTDGYEDLELDITAMVEEWISGKHANYGLGVFLTSSLEGYVSNSSGQNTDVLIHNTAGARRSYYTKKFFSRSSEFFFKRPLIEARWDSRITDDRGNFYASSSIAPGPDNLNNLYLYNYIRGRLVDIPHDETVTVKLFASTDNSPAGSQLASATAAKISTGIYRAQIAVDTTESRLHDVWSGTVGGEYKTGSISVKNFNDENVLVSNDFPRYSTSITNLKSKYVKNEQARFRVFARQVGLAPTLYTVANSVAQPSIIQSASFEILRVVDNHTVINNSTGSTSYHTYLSYDNSGSYFDLDMSLLEPGYMYGIKFSYHTAGDWREQEEVFKFRVEDN